MQINVPLPPWLLTVSHNCKEAYGIVRRLGLPHTTVEDKFKYRKYVPSRPSEAPPVAALFFR